MFNDVLFVAIGCVWGERERKRERERDGVCVERGREGGTFNCSRVSSYVLFVVI